MTKKRSFVSQTGKIGSKRSQQANQPFDRDRVALWFGMILVALLSVIFLIALVQQDADLMEKVLSVLIMALKLALTRAFNAESKK